MPRNTRQLAAAAARTAGTILGIHDTATDRLHPGALAALDGEHASTRQHLLDHHGIDLTDPATRTIALAVLDAAACISTVLYNDGAIDLSRHRPTSDEHLRHSIATGIALARIGVPVAAAHQRYLQALDSEET